MYAGALEGCFSSSCSDSEQTIGSEFPVSTALLNFDRTTFEAVRYSLRELMIVHVNVDDEAVRSSVVLSYADAYNSR